MIKRILILATIFTICFSACSNSPDKSIVSSSNENSTAKKINNESFISERNPLNDGIFRLTMNRGNIEEVLKSRNLDCSVVNPVIIQSKELKVYFELRENKDSHYNERSSISSIYNYDNKEISTDKGLKIGDSVEKMLQLYGKDFVTHNEPDVLGYTYKIGESFFNVSISTSDKAVVGWGVSIECPYWDKKSK